MSCFKPPAWLSKLTLPTAAKSLRLRFPCVRIASTWMQTAGEGALNLSIRVNCKHKDCLLEIQDLKARLVSEEAKARTLQDLKDKAFVLLMIQPLLGKRSNEEAK